MSTAADLVRSKKQPLSETLERILRLGRVSGVGFEWRASCRDVFGDKTELPVFDNALDSPHNEAVVEVCVPPIDWLQLQMAAAESFIGESQGYRWLMEPVERAENTRDMAQKLSSGETDIPKPVLELDRDGNVTGFQEGRNRGVAAHYADIDWIPVAIVLNGSKTGGLAIASPLNGYEIEAELDAHRSTVMAQTN